MPRTAARIVLSLLLFLLFGELGSRIWIARSWTPERIEQLTTHSAARGRFTSHPYLPYVLNPDFQGHNALGFRGAPLEQTKPAGVRRIACEGASTTYGSFVEPEEAFPAQLRELLDPAHGPWEVVNAGVPGWLSSESLINFELRVLPLDPDVLVILEGRNEVLPQAYNHFRADYSHYRRPGFNYVVSNYMHKEIFKWSRLAMLLCTVRGERFGWSELEEHPLYGGLVWENRPTTDEVALNLRDPARMEPLRLDLETMIGLCLARGIRVIVCTMPFRPDKLALEELGSGAELGGLVGQQVDRNNELARATAKRFGATVVETAGLAERGDLFLDDCHMNAEGHRLEARMIFEALEREIDGR
jgi:lysophospholipase L1-like esterase